MLGNRKVGTTLIGSSAPIFFVTTLPAVSEAPPRMPRRRCCQGGRMDRAEETTTWPGNMKRNGFFVSH